MDWGTRRAEAHDSSQTRGLGTEHVARNRVHVDRFPTDVTATATDLPTAVTIEVQNSFFRSAGVKCVSANESVRLVRVARLKLGGSMRKGFLLSVVDALLLACGG